MEYASAKAPRASRPVDVAGLSSIHPAQAGAGARSGSEVALGTSLRRRSPDTGACPSRSFGAFGARGHARQAAETLWTLSRAAQRTALGPGEALPGSQEDGLNPHEDRERGSFARGFISIPKLLCLKRKLSRNITLQKPSRVTNMSHSRQGRALQCTSCWQTLFT